MTGLITIMRPLLVIKDCSILTQVVKGLSKMVEHDFRLDLIVTEKVSGDLLNFLVEFE